MKDWKIYKHTSPSGKVYIGQTKQTLNNRWLSNGNGYKTQRYINRAILKYGWDNFEHQIIQTTDTKEKADILEKMWISFYKKRNGVYNMTDGGEGCINRTPWNKGLKNCYTEESLQKMSIAHKGQVSGKKGKTGFVAWNKGIPCRQETKEKLSIINSGRVSPMKGKHHTEETKLKISLSQKERIKLKTNI